MAVATSLQAKALRLLAMRDHSRQELARKLADDNTDPLLLEQYLDELEQAGYLDNARYADAVLRSAVTRGQGPLKVVQVLRSKGLPADQVRALLSETEIDWHALAAEQRRRKFGADVPNVAKERARQGRFLAGRGFYLETINAVFHEKC